MEKTLKEKMDEAFGHFKQRTPLGFPNVKENTLYAKKVLFELDPNWRVIDYRILIHDENGVPAFWVPFESGSVVVFVGWRNARAVFPREIPKILEREKENEAKRESVHTEFEIGLGLLGYEMNRSMELDDEAPLVKKFR